MKDSLLNNLPFQPPNIPNTHGVIETIAKNQKEIAHAVLKRMDKLASLQEHQNQVLEQILEELRAR